MREQRGAHARRSLSAPGMRPGPDGFLPGVLPVSDPPRRHRAKPVRAPARRSAAPARRSVRRNDTGWQAPPKPRESRPRVRRRGPGMRVVWAFVLSLAGVVGMLVAASAWTAQQVSDDVDRVPEAFPDGDRPAAVAGGGLTFLLVGVDTSEGTTDSPAVELVTVGHLTEDRQHLQFVSLPTDLATTPDGGTATLADTFNGGGPSALVGAVETLSGIRVDHYVDLDLEAFRSLTDEIGGLVVDVPAALDTRGHHFDAGPQRLDGEEALAYMRTPRREGEPVEALDRQQQVVSGLFQQVRSQGRLSDPDSVTGLVGLLTKSLRVDDTVDATLMTRLGLELRDVGKPEVLTVPLADAAAGDPGPRVDADRSAAMWDYLSRDTLIAHMGEFS
jgi:LCP family protein required for cell wall assembly